MRKVIAKEIMWDTDDFDPKALGLPEDVEVEIPDWVEDDEISSYVSDYLSDNFDFCHFGFALVED